jgi:hypothetical protein
VEHVLETEPLIMFTSDGHSETRREVRRVGKTSDPDVLTWRNEGMQL